MSELKEVGSVSHPNTKSKSFSDVLKSYLSDLAITNKEFAESLSISYSTYQRRKKEPVSQRAVSLFTNELVRRYEKQSQKEGIGHREHVNILNNLLDAAGYKSIQIDLWHHIKERGSIRVGYTNAPPLIWEPDKKPESECGLVAFTKMVASMLGLEIEWKKVQTFCSLQESLYRQEVDVIAPILRRVPGHHHVNFSQECGLTENVCIVMNKEAAGDRLMKAEMEQQSFESMLEKPGGPLSSLDVSSSKQIELVYLRSEIGEFIANYLSQKANLKSTGVRSMTEAFSRTEEKRLVSCFVLGQEKRNYWVKNYYSERVLFRNLLTFPAANENLGRLTKSLGFAVLPGQNELLKRINTIVKAADSMEGYQQGY